MSDANVTVERDGAIAVLTLSNPGRANAIDDRLRTVLRAALAELTTDDDVRAIVLSGAGGIFCAGGELGSMPTADRVAMNSRLSAMHTIARLLVTSPKPVVAAVEGAAYGSGAALAMTADVVVAASDARFGFTFTRVGLAPDTGVAWTLSRRIGAAPARRLLLFGEAVDGTRALELGVADELCEPGAALEKAREHAARLVAGAPLALAATRRLLDAAQGSLDDVLTAEYEAQLRLWQSADFAEGRQAFFDKRRPDFTGH